MVDHARDILEGLSSMGITIEAHGDHLRFRPQSAMSPALLEAVKSSKTELLGILRESPTRSYADREFDRFSACAVQTSSGGLCDPDCSPELAELIKTGGFTFEDSTPPLGVPTGWSVNGWRRHMLHMADSCNGQHPEKGSEYRRKAEQLEDCPNG